MNVLSLFSGIGGLEVGLERAGMTTVGQVEINPYCREVLNKHWPEVPKHDDVRTCVEWWRSKSRPAVHVVAGGPPCQGTSYAGGRLGVADPRWGWPWLIDVVRELGPEFVVVENPPALLSLHDGDAFGGILGALADLGFDAEWSVLSACAMGAPHTRERLFLVAHSAGGRREPGRGVGPAAEEVEPRRRDAQPGGPWTGEPGIHGVAYGVSRGMDRRRALGNAVVPAVAEHIGRLVMAHARTRTRPRSEPGRLRGLPQEARPATGGSGMKRTEMKSRYRNTGPAAEVVDAVYARAGFSCELCGAAVGDRRGVDHHIHHRRPRRMGGSRMADTNSPVNLLLLDPSCHDRVEKERTAAYEGGWLVRQDEDPAVVPALVCGERWVFLTAEAEYSPAPVAS